MPFDNIIRHTFTTSGVATIATGQADIQYWIVGFLVHNNSQDPARVRIRIGTTDLTGDYVYLDERGSHLQWPIVKDLSDPYFKCCTNDTLYVISQDSKNIAGVIYYLEEAV